MTIIVGDNLSKMQTEVKIELFTTEENINLKNLAAEKIGYSSKFFYFGESGDGKSIYGGYKISSVISESIISICGYPKDIKKAHKNLETKLDKKLINFVKSKNYTENSNETESMQNL